MTDHVAHRHVLVEDLDDVIIVIEPRRIPLYRNPRLPIRECDSVECLIHAQRDGIRVYA